MSYNISAEQKNRIESMLKRYLEQQQNIIFVYLFGSFVEKGTFRDIDIGIYSKSAKLTELGRMHADLAKKTKMEVDITYLNGLPSKHPVLAHQIICNGKLLLCNDNERQTDYKRRSFLHYFDTAPLRKQIKNAFDKRLHNKKFGARNYA